MFCVSTNVIIDNFEKEDQLGDNLKVNANCELKRDPIQIQKQPKKQNYLQNLMDIFDEPEKLEKLKLYPERALKHKHSTTNMAPLSIASQVPVTIKPVARPVTSLGEVTQQSHSGKLNYAQF